MAHRDSRQDAQAVSERRAAHRDAERAKLERFYVVRSAEFDAELARIVAKALANGPKACTPSCVWIDPASRLAVQALKDAGFVFARVGGNPEPEETNE